MAARRFPQTSSQMPRGRSLLRDPRYNRGTAFTLEEREVLGPTGLLPPRVVSLEQQCERAYEQYLGRSPRPGANRFLAALHDRNEVVFYRLIERARQRDASDGLTPPCRAGDQRYSHQFQRPQGVYLSDRRRRRRRARLATRARVRRRRPARRDGRRGDPRDRRLGRRTGWHLDRQARDLHRRRRASTPAASSR